MLEFCLLCVLQHLSASPASFCLKAIDEENSEKKKEFKETRKKGREKENERERGGEGGEGGGGEREKERGTLLES